MNKLFICDIDMLSESSSRGFSLQLDEDSIEGFVVQKDGLYYAYLNTCPHIGVPLDWVEHQFLDIDGAFIQCANHDARFMIEDGKCIAGPCVGESLQKLEVIQQGNALYLKL